MTSKLYLHFLQTALQHIVLPEEETIVGRTSSCNVDLTRYMHGNLKAVSRQHFKISYTKGEGFILVDISHNGTQVNDTLLTSRERRILRDGDVLKLANNDDFKIKISIDDDPDITETVDDPSLLFLPKDEAGLGFYYDSEGSQFVVNEVPVPHEHLTKLEVALLKYFYENSGGLCTFDDIALHVWSDPGWAPGNNTISRAVSNLRKKLDQVSPGAGDYIQNIRGQGYKVIIRQ